jgi:hypothetical protein
MKALQSLISDDWDCNEDGQDQKSNLTIIQLVLSWAQAGDKSLSGYKGKGKGRANGFEPELATTLTRAEHLLSAMEKSTSAISDADREFSVPDLIDTAVFAVDEHESKALNVERVLGVVARTASSTKTETDCGTYDKAQAYLQGEISGPYVANVARIA